MKAFFNKLTSMSLVTQIIIGVILGIVVAQINVNWAENVTFLGAFFVKSLKSVAPVLVFVLVMAAISQHKVNEKTHIKDIIVLYLLGTFLAATTAVLASYIFHPTLLLEGINKADDINHAPQAIGSVLKTLLFNISDNPFNAIVKANYIGILAWAVLLGLSLRYASENTKAILNDTAEAVSFVVRMVIRFAPVGVFGLVASTLAKNDIVSFVKSYSYLLMVLLGSMFFVALVVNPLLVYWKIRRNPYPLVFTCLRESGLTAFFTRSSAANIPVNMALCKRLNLHEDTYSISIPLGASINMAGAAITITVMTLAAANTMQIDISITKAILLSVIASLSACGASGVAGGSLLLIPLACSMFGISNDIAGSVIGIGVAIGVLQDSTETALNSSTDVLFTAAAEFGKKLRS